MIRSVVFAAVLLLAFPVLAPAADVAAGQAAFARCKICHSVQAGVAALGERVDPALGWYRRHVSHGTQPRAGRTPQETGMAAATAVAAVSVP